MVVFLSNFTFYYCVRSHTFDIMVLHIKKTKSKNFEHYSIIYDVNINGKRTSKVFENIGNLEKLKERAGNEDPLIWLKNYVDELNKKIK